MPTVAIVAVFLDGDKNMTYLWLTGAAIAKMR